MKKIGAFFTGRLFIVSVAILVQIAALVLLIINLSNYFVYAYAVFVILSIICILSIISKRDNPVFKLAWVVPIALFPLFGWLMYYIGGDHRLSKKRRAQISEMGRLAQKFLPENDNLVSQVKENDDDISRIMSYVKNVSAFPVYNNTQTEYLTPGESFFERLCKELEKAEKYIFMEYFIIEKGQMWDTVLEILKRKAREGVEVKMIYDDLGCIQTLPNRYYKSLRESGIEVQVFNVFTPSVDIFVNYRDHRKITVIDGKIAFTGGNNLADEYINAYVKHGYWKDSSILVRGDAVWSFTIMFLQMWNYCGENITDCEKYKTDEKAESDGIALPYGDSPLDNNLVGETIYRQIIDKANEYVSITTPYLILDNEMMTALCSAALSGVKVTIITPNIPDKWYVHMITRSNYAQLIDAGVEIYEHTGSFIHAKTIVSDDSVAVVGTQNFDFRSFYFHFECGILLYESKTIGDVREDHLNVIEKSHRITAEECSAVAWPVRILRSCLNLFAPLM